ncbi:hypothetical protein [Yoonia sp. SS1-5]|uniref:Uncharacterized protein n=1 Tax=Yoonia rhodophyticola TaxID=3137370 RepID=A0AAN0M7L5_9RHOB
MSQSVATSPTLAERLATIFQRGDTKDLIANAAVDVDQITIDGQVFPITTSDADQSGLGNPLQQLVAQTLTEPADLHLADRLRQGLGKGRGPLLKAAKLDKHVQFNNWLFPDNPAPALQGDQVTAMRDALIAAHPTRTIMIRSLTTGIDDALMAALSAAGFALLPTKPIWVTPVPSQRRAPVIAGHDLVDAHTFSANDFSRAAMLQAMADAQIPDTPAPRYTPGFLAQAHQIDLLKIKGVRDGAENLIGVVGVFEAAGVISAPIMGYDPDFAGAAPLRGALEQLVFAQASAEAAHYKTSRWRGPNASPAMSQTAVYVQHLGWQARAALKALKPILQGMPPAADD